MKFLEISKTQYKVSDFLMWQKSKSLKLAPKYQRRSVWNAAKKSYLIDTVIRGLPVPIIFIRERPTEISSYQPIREVVDGQQRIRTLVSFIDSGLLKDFKRERDYFVISKAHNKELGGLQFCDLDDDYKRKILDYQFSVHVLPSDVDDRELLAIFSRLNSTGVKLNMQELRNAQFFGEFKTSVYQEAYSQLNRWIQWKIFSDSNISRMEEVELTSELYIFMLRGIKGKSSTAIDTVYKEYDAVFIERDIVEYRFRKTMETIDEYFGRDIQTTEFRKKTIFYILFCTVYAMLFGDTRAVEDQKEARVSIDRIRRLYTLAQNISDKLAPDKVMAASSRRTTHKLSRDCLYEYFMEIESNDDFDHA